jgi:hypothetical protein
VAIETFDLHCTRNTPDHSVGRVDIQAGVAILAEEPFPVVKVLLKLNAVLSVQTLLRGPFPGVHGDGYGVSMSPWNDTPMRRPRLWNTVQVSTGIPV